MHKVPVQQGVLGNTERIRDPARNTQNAVDIQRTKVPVQTRKSNLRLPGALEGRSKKRKP